MNILVVDDDQGVRKLLTEFISELNYPVQARASGEEALVEFARVEYDLIFLDLQMPGMDGFEVLRRIKELNNECEVIIITAYGSVNSAIQALNMGAYAYINKPFDFVELERIIIRVKELIDLRQAYRLLANERLRSFHLDNLVSVSPAMREVKKRIIKSGEAGSSTLIIGELGTGKRFVSRIMHFNGNGKESLLLQINAEDLESLLTSGNFKHSDGVTISLENFPDDLIQQGYGTVVLNGIQNIAPKSMEKLSEVLQQILTRNHYATKYNNFRLLGILDIPRGFSNPDVLVAENLWNCFSDFIVIPTLEERTECIVPLAQLFFQSIVAVKGGRNFYISQPVREFLRLYEWPGNISELKFILDRLSITCPSRLISADDLHNVQRDYIENSERPFSNLSGLLTQAEKQLISQTFRQKTPN